MHTKNLFVSDDGSTLCAADPINRCIGVAYGWDREFEYDTEGKLVNRPEPNDEARANAKLWAGADGLAEALKKALAEARPINRRNEPRQGDGCTYFVEVAEWPDWVDAARAALEKAGIA